MIQVAPTDEVNYVSGTWFIFCSREVIEEDKKNVTHNQWLNTYFFYDAISNH